MLEACRGDQFSYEYRQGVASYGAFTYSLVHNLRRRGRGGDPSFKKLPTAAGTFLRQLRYNQTPQIVGPKAELEKPIP